MRERLTDDHESAKERERPCRLQHTTERLAAESAEEREARLQQMRTRQHEQLSVETYEERSQARADENSPA